MAKVLDVNTQRVRNSISIDGNPYFIKELSELSLAERARVADASNRIKTYFEKNDKGEFVSPEDGQLTSKAARDAVNDLFVDGLPDEVQDALSDNNRIEIIASFFKAPEEKKDPETEAESKEVRETTS